MITKDLVAAGKLENIATGSIDFASALRFASRVVMAAAVALSAYGLVWNFSTRRYLKGFTDAIIPLAGSAEDKTNALAEWFHHEPQRIETPEAGSTNLLSDRDPVNIVKNERLLKVCGSASNAFMNLAMAADLPVRRLLLLDQSGSVMHVVAEVRWGDRWVVVNPNQGLVFRDQHGRALTKEELRNPEVFRDAISRMPGYDRSYNFQHTIHIRLGRIPILGNSLRPILNRLAPGWEEATNWAYFPENPSLWILFVSLPLFLLGVLLNLLAKRYDRSRREAKPNRLSATDEAVAS
jgi:hypothetical protein